MNDDELIERLRRTLRDEASQLDAPPDGWERFQRRAAGAAPRKPRWLFAAPVAAVGLAAAVVAAVAVSTGSATKRSSRTEVAAPGATVAPATTAAAASEAPAATAPASGAAAAPQPATAAGVPSLAGFQPRSVTFASATEGFALGATAIAHTTDGGRAWTALPAPPAPDLSGLRFANGSDGWAWGPGLWATHDGGHSWHRLTVPGADGRVYDLEAAAGTVHVAVFTGQGFAVATAAAGTDAFTLSEVAPSVPIGAGPVPTVQLVLQGRTGWMIEVDRTVIGGLRLVNGAWQPWTPPCVGTNGPALLGASSPSDVVAVCAQGVWGPATPMGERLWMSHDGGATFTDVGAVPVGNVGAVASASPITVIVTVPTGPVEATFDGGRTWGSVLSSSGLEATDLGFTTAAQGTVVLHAPGQPGSLWMTYDGGHTWTEVRFS